MIPGSLGRRSNRLDLGLPLGLWTNHPGRRAWLGNDREGLADVGRLVGRAGVVRAADGHGFTVALAGGVFQVPHPQDWDPHRVTSLCSLT